MSFDSIQSRMLFAAGQRSYRELGTLTGFHPETIRRYMAGQAPSSRFLQALSKATGIDPGWLLTGRVPESTTESVGAELDQLKTRVAELTQELEALKARSHSPQSVELVHRSRATSLFQESPASSSRPQ